MSKAQLRINTNKKNEHKALHWRKEGQTQRTRQGAGLNAWKAQLRAGQAQQTTAGRGNHTTTTTTQQPHGPH